MPTAPNYFAGGEIDRASHLRKDEAWIGRQLEGAEARLLPVWRSRHLIRDEPSGPRAVLLPANRARPLVEAGGPPVFLGLVAGAPCFALDLSLLDEPLHHPALEGAGRFTGLRRVGALLDRTEGGLLAYARAMMSWHRRHRHCGLCGSRTESRAAGHERRCTGDGCGAVHFPRTDPAVIMLVVHGDGCLLARQSRWPEGVFSTLAGFVEPGESLEEAVAREVREETGVRVATSGYHSSQPWPFPGSLMVGFTAEAETRDLEVDLVELETARWFERVDLLEAIRSEAVRLPSEISIARRLIEDWLGGAAAERGAEVRPEDAEEWRYR